MEPGQEEEGKEGAGSELQGGLEAGGEVGGGGGPGVAGVPQLIPAPHNHPTNQPLQQLLAN